MEITYDKEADALYVEFIKTDFGKNKKVDEHTILDLDKKGNVIGIELLDASKRMPKDAWNSIHARNILVLQKE